MAAPSPDGSGGPVAGDKVTVTNRTGQTISFQVDGGAVDSQFFNDETRTVLAAEVEIRQDATLVVSVQRSVPV